MKKTAILLLILCMLVCCWGCGKKGEKKPDTWYALVGVSMDNKAYMGKEDLEKYSDGEEYYIYLREDGTVELKIQPGEPLIMHTDGEKLWRAEEPELVAYYTIEGNSLTMEDYPFTYYFEK